MNEYWQQLARELIAEANSDDLYGTDGNIATWIGRATATLAEALRVSETANA